MIHETTTRHTRVWSCVIEPVAIATFVRADDVELIRSGFTDATDSEGALSQGGME